MRWKISGGYQDPSWLPNDPKPPASVRLNGPGLCNMLEYSEKMMKWKSSSLFIHFISRKWNHFQHEILIYLYVSIKYTVMQEGLWFKSDKFKNFIPRKMSNLVFLMKYSVSILVRFLFNFWIASTQHMNFFPETFKNIRLLLLNKKCIWLRRIYQKMIYSSSAKLNHVQTTLPNWIFLFLFSASLSG